MRDSKMASASSTSPFERDGVLYTRNLVLRSMCAVYLIAFLVFYHQSEGLFGSNGILPAKRLLENIGTAKISAMHTRPTLLHLSSIIGLDVPTMMDLLSLLGVMISFSGFISQKFCLLPTFAALWSLYFSLIQISQDFMHQSDELLLEAGMLCVILAPLKSHKKRSPVDSIGLLMLRWLLFRFMFASGSVKLASGCPLWWSLRGLKRHFETMPLPTPLSWYSYYLPESYLHLSTVYVYLSELICPWLFFAPNRTIRKFAFYWQFFLHLNIIASGNYGFLSFLVITLLFSLLDDSFFYPKKNKQTDVGGIVLTVLVFSGIIFGTWKYFGLGIRNGEFVTKILFSKSQYLEVMKLMIKMSPLTITIVILSSFLTTIVSHTSIVNAKSLLQKVGHILNLLFFTIVCLALVGVSTVPHGNLNPTTNITNSAMGKTFKRFNQLHMVNQYGRHLVKMRSERLEIILEHSNNIEGPWKEYEFLYKPWNVNHSLPFAGPYLPRLDNKFHDAAPAHFNDHLWITSLAYRLLQNEQSVLKLFGIYDVPQKPPKFVRGIVYKFKYTTWSERNNHAYWTRSRLAEYFPAFSIDDGPLHAYLKSQNIPLNYQKQNVNNDFLKSILDGIKVYATSIEGSYLVLGVLAAGFTLIATQKKK